MNTQPRGSADPRRGFTRCGLDFDSNRRRLFNEEGDRMRPASRFNTIARVSFPNSVGKAAMKAARLNEADMQKDHDQYDAEARRINQEAEIRALRSSVRPPPRTQVTPKQRFRSRTRLDQYYPEHKDTLNLHPLKPLKPWETTNEDSYRSTMATFVPPKRTTIAPQGWSPLPRRATPPGAWVPGGLECMPRSNFDFMKHAANKRASMLLPLGDQRPAEARTYVP